jgi:hypothetical protein
MSLCKVRWQKKAPGARDQVSKAAEVLKPETHQGRQGTMRLEMTTTCNPNFGASWEEKAILPEGTKRNTESCRKSERLNRQYACRAMDMFSKEICVPSLIVNLDC